jgi:antitoxin MazE
MRTHIRKWGNSLALRIPKALAVEAGIEEECVVDVRLDGDGISVTAVRPGTYTLDGLLAGVTPDNVHGEIRTGRSVGREAW